MIVTGGAGIGADIVRAFAEQGCRVGFVDRDAGAGAAGSQPGGRSLRACDVTDVPALQAAIARGWPGPWAASTCWSAMSPTTSATASRVTPAYFDRRHIAVNLRPHFFATQAVLASMRARGGSIIVNIGSGGWKNKARSLSVATASQPCSASRAAQRAAGARPHPRQLRRARLGDDQTAAGAVGRCRGRGRMDPQPLPPRAHRPGPRHRRTWCCSSPPTRRRVVTARGIRRRRRLDRPASLQPTPLLDRVGGAAPTPAAGRAGVGDALAVFQLGRVVAGAELLRARVQVALRHHAEDAAVAGLHLLRDVAPPATGARAACCCWRGCSRPSARCGSRPPPAPCRPRHLGGVVVGRLAAAQDDVAILVASGLDDGGLAVLGHRQEVVRAAGGLDGVDGDLQVAVGAVLEADRRRLRPLRPARGGTWLSVVRAPMAPR